MARRIAFVTGASRGIGAAAALRLAEIGYDVVLTARTLHAGEAHDHGGPDGNWQVLPGSLDQTADAVRARGRDALALRLDLLDRASLAAAIEETEKHWGPVDLLLNNAIVQTSGIMDHVMDLDDEKVERLHQGNVLAPLWLIQRVLPGMRERGHGTILNMVSESAFSDPPAPAGEGGWGWAYSASKAALARLVGVLAAETRGSGVRLFNVEPGFILTEMVRAAGYDEEFAWRGAPPEVPAAVIGWLASEEAALEWHGKTVSAQKLCKELGLVPGWPPPRPAR